MRKQDDEATEILLASIKLGILSRHKETFLPSINTLLHFPYYPPCVVGYYALYLLFILEDFSEFYSFSAIHKLDPFYTATAKSLVHRNYVAYTRLLHSAKPLDKALIIDSPADIRLRSHIINV